MHGLRERAFICSHGVREGGRKRDVEELCRDGHGFGSGHGALLQEYYEHTEVAVGISRNISRRGGCAVSVHVKMGYGESDTTYGPPPVPRQLTYTNHSRHIQITREMILKYTNWFPVVSRVIHIIN